MPRIRTRVRIVPYGSAPVVTEDLHHLTLNYQSYVDMPGNNTAHAGIGRATIPLYPPGSPEFKRNSPWYSKLALGQRVEIYPATGPGVAKPLWTGIIDRLPMNRNSYSIEAADSISIAQNSHRFIPFTTSETADNIITKYGLQYYKPLYLDSLSGPLASYTTETDPGGSWTSSLVEGKRSLRWTFNGSVSAVGDVRFGSGPAPAEFIWVADFVVNLPKMTGAGAAVVGMTFTPNATSPAMQLQINMPSSANQLITAQAYCFNRSSLVCGVGQFFPVGVTDTNGNLTLRIQMAVVVKPTVNGNTPFEILVNGQSVGAVDSGTGAGNHLPTSDLTGSSYTGVGPFAQASVTTGSISGLSIGLSNYVMLVGAPLFQTGTIGTPKVVNNPPTHTFNNATNLEIIKTAAAQENWTIYKDPGVNWSGDVLHVY